MVLRNIKRAPVKKTIIFSYTAYILIIYVPHMLYNGPLIVSSRQKKMYDEILLSKAV